MVNAESRTSAFCDIDRRFVHVSERAAFRWDSGERRRWAWMMSAGNRASFSPCPPGTHARCAAASLSPASSFDAGPLGLAQECEHALLLGGSLDLWLVSLQRRVGAGRGGRD